MYTIACVGASAEERVKALLGQIYSELRASSDEGPSIPAPESIMEKVVVVEGDVCEARFGLSDELYEKMASEVGVVIHTAAQVNSVLPYTGKGNCSLLIHNALQSHHHVVYV